MELRHLRSFAAVAETEHVGRAARRLALAQPALSRQLAQLEEELGVALLERRGRGIRLTQAGRIFADDARKTLEAASRAAARARRAAAGELGTLALGFVQTALWAGEALRVVHAYRRRYPAVTLELVPMSSRRQWSALREERLDVGLVFHTPERGGERGGELAETIVLRDRVALALPRAHPLARRPRVRLRDLGGVPFIWFPRAASPTFHDDVARATAAAGLALHVTQESADAATRLSLVAAGLGVTFTTASARRRKPEGVVVRDVDDLELEQTISALWRREDRSPHVRAFVALLDEA